MRSMMTLMPRLPSARPAGYRRLVMRTTAAKEATVAAGASLRARPGRRTRRRRRSGCAVLVSLLAVPT